MIWEKYLRVIGIEECFNKLCGFVDAIESGNAKNANGLMKIVIDDWLERI